MSTSVGGGWSIEANRSDMFPRPQSPPSFPFTQYEAERAVLYRNRLLTVSQAWDLSVGRRVIPFVATGVEFRRVTRQQNSVFVGYSDSSSRSSSSTERSGTQLSALAAAGIRVLVSRHGVVTADGSFFWYDSEHGVVPEGGIFFSSQPSTLLGHISGRWRVGAGVRF